MKLLIVFLFFTIGLSQCESTQKRIPVWGYYCGLSHTNQNGIEPIDQMDRYCQYHDICVTARGYLDCWCNEQLYYLVSNVKPQSQEESDTKNQILTFIYDSLIGCTNYWNFDTFFVVTKISEDDRGYNYLTFYPSISSQTYTTRLTTYNDTGFLLRLDRKQYNEFTADIYRDPIQSISKWIPYKITDLDLVDYTFQVYPGEYYVIYNPSVVNPGIYHVKNETGCARLTLYYRRSRSVVLRKIASHIEPLWIVLGVVGCVVLGISFAVLGLVLQILRIKKYHEPQRNDIP